MPQGVHAFDVVDEMHIRPEWVRNALGVSVKRYGRLKRGELILTHEEVERLSTAMKEVYGVSKRRLFDKDAEVLPPGRRRRTKGTVTTTKTTKGNAA